MSVSRKGACIHMRLLCTVPCKKPMDVLFLLKAGEQIEDMKTFVKSFIKNADIGMHPKNTLCTLYM